MARKKREKSAPIAYWSHSSLMAYLRNPLAWYKRYVEKIYDVPSGPSSIVGRAGHVALQHFYGGVSKEGSLELGLEYMREVPDFEVNFGKKVTKAQKKKKRADMERQYLQAAGFYLEHPPRHDVVGVEVKGTAEVPRVALPIKAVSDLVVVSKGNTKGLDIVDHKFVDSYSSLRGDKTLFMMQAIFNYYTVKAMYGKPVHRFIVYECKKSKNTDGRRQLRKYVIDYEQAGDAFDVFRRLVNDATAEISRTRVFLPNPSDMFEGEDSFEIYRLGLVGDGD